MPLHYITITALGLALFSSGALACAPGDEVRLDQSFAMLSPLEQAGFEALFTAERTIMADEGISVDETFAFGRCDLSYDTPPAVLVTAKPGLFCDGLCMTWAMNQTGDGIWQIILAAEGALHVAASTSMGLPDLVARAPGAADIVHKYDGSSYRDDLEGLIYGELFDLPEAHTWQADPSGFVGIIPADAIKGEAAIARDLIVAAHGTGADGLELGLTDLNGDAVPEVIVEGHGAQSCTAQGCRTWIVSITGNTGTILADVTAQGSLEIAASTANGYRDIIVWGSDGATVLRHDGAVYR